MRQTQALERLLGDSTRRILPVPLAEFVMFVLKQAWACLFAILLLVAIIGTKAIWNADWPIARYDALVIIAVLIQAGMLFFKLETWDEAKVILLFHLTGTAMELFKVNAGSWSYPEAGMLKVMGVPLFSGFMYAAVGSFMARVIRLFDMTFSPFPPLWAHFGLAVAIYINFFAHHFIMDTRYVLFALTVILYGRTRIWFRIGENWYWMPLPLAAALSAFFLWVAENVGTSTGTWVYAGQSMLEMVNIAKMGSWYLLLFVSFATVTLVFRDALKQDRVLPRSRQARQTAQFQKPIQRPTNSARGL